MINVLRLSETTHDESFSVDRKHGHPFYLLLLVKTPAYFTVDGREVLIKKDAGVLFLPGQAHDYRAAGEPYTDCWMHIESTSPLLYEGFPFGKPFPLNDPERFYDLFSIIHSMYFTTYRMREQILDSLVNALILMMASETEVKGALFSPFLTLREAVFRTPKRKWSVAEEAHKIGVSEGYFHALYKQYFHTTFTSDVIASRIQAAEELLLATPYSVEQIAEQCGYLNTEHFIRQFKNATGKTPRSFRKE